MNHNVDIYILQIETSADNCSVCLSSNGQSLTTKEVKQSNMHATKLTCLIEQVLEESLPTGNKLSAIAVSMGPGSYTGLRIGISTAKGLCYALDIPLLAIETLDAMFYGFSERNTKLIKSTALYVPMLDARRMEVYVKFFKANGECIYDTKALIIEENTIQDLTKNSSHVYLFGTGAEKLSSLYSKNSVVKIIPDFIPSADFMSQLAFSKYKNEDIEDTAYFEPFYLKDFIPTIPKKTSLL